MVTKRIECFGEQQGKENEYEKKDVGFGDYITGYF